MSVGIMVNDGGTYWLKKRSASIICQLKLQKSIRILAALGFLMRMGIDVDTAIVLCTMTCTGQCDTISYLLSCASSLDCYVRIYVRYHDLIL